MGIQHQLSAGSTKGARTVNLRDHVNVLHLLRVDAEQLPHVRQAVLHYGLAQLHLHVHVQRIGVELSRAEDAR